MSAVLALEFSVEGELEGFVELLEEKFLVVLFQFLLNLLEHFGKVLLGVLLCLAL